MKNTVVFILFSFITIGSFSQTDSLQIVSFNLSECTHGNGCERESSYRVINSNFDNDTLDINIKGYANCGGAHNSQITRIKNEIFITFEDGKGIDLSSADTSGFSIDKITKDTIYDIIWILDLGVDCDCFYDFNFKILGLNSNQLYHYYINDNYVLKQIPKEQLLKDSLEKDTVKQIIHKIKEIKYHKSELSSVICKKYLEDKSSNYCYHITLFEDGTHKAFCEFIVYPKNDYKIAFYYGFFELSFEEWRKYREYPQWNEFWDMAPIIREDRNESK